MSELCDQRKKLNRMMGMVVVVFGLYIEWISWHAVSLFEKVVSFSLSVCDVSHE